MAFLDGDPRSADAIAFSDAELYVLSRKAYKSFRKKIDYSEYGGAPLLGVRGGCIIGHGSSNANAIKNAIRVAAEFSGGNVNQQIEEELLRIGKARV